METLEKLFGGALKVKLMRLFLFNPTIHFQTTDIADRLNVDTSRLRKDLSTLHSIKLIRKISRGGRPTYFLNTSFTYLSELQKLLLQSGLISNEALIKRFSKVGRLKTVVLAGLFKEQWEDRIDILIVADTIKKGKAESIIKHMESEIGKEIRYAVLDTADFKYRLSIGDKLVRDIVDYPHDIILDKLGFLPVV